MKKIKNLKNNFMFPNQNYNFNSNNAKETINYQIKKNKPITTRIKLDLMTEDNKRNLIKNNIKDRILNNNSYIRTKSNSNSSNKRIIYIDNNNFKNITSRPIIYNSLSPNFQNIKRIMNKNKISNIKEIYNNINYNNNQGRNTYNIYASSQMNQNSHNFNNNINPNSKNKIIIKKIKKHNIKNNPNNITKTINYNAENIYEYPITNLYEQNKKIIVFNNGSNSNYNINSLNNNLHNLINLKDTPNNNNMHKKTIEILSPFSSINNKNYNNNHKKFYINKQNNTQIINNNEISSNNRKNNMELLGQNIISLDKHKIKNIHTFTGINNPNKYLYNKNMINKLNKNDNYNHHNNINSSQYSYNIRLNNNNNFQNNLHYSNSNDKERNTISNQSYSYLYLNKNGKSKNNKEKNITLEILKSYNKKHMSPIQELKNKF